MADNDEAYRAALTVLVEQARTSAQLAARRAQEAALQLTGEGGAVALAHASAVEAGGHSAAAAEALAQVVARAADIAAIIAANIPGHQFSGTQLRLRNPDGSWGDYVDLNVPPLLGAFLTALNAAGDAPGLILQTGAGAVAKRAIGAANASDVLDLQSADSIYMRATAINALVSSAVNAAVNALVAGAPGHLNTLDELAAAINDDANYAAAVTAALAAINATLATLGTAATKNTGLSNGNVVVVQPDGKIHPSLYALAEGLGVGDIIPSARNPGANYLRCNGAVYLQATYPLLYAAIGKLNSFGALVQRTSQFSTDPVNGLAAGAGVFVAVGGTGSALISSSSDGQTWTTRTPNVAAQLTAVVWNGSKFLAVGTTGATTASADGLTWASQTGPGGAFNSTALAWNGTVFVVVSNGGAISTSTTGSGWTSRTSPFGGTGITGVAWNGSVFVAVGGSGKVATSPDGTTWTLQATVTGSPNLKGVVWTGSAFVAVAQDAYTSPDGVTWTLRTTGSVQVLNAVHYHGNLVIAAGVNGVAYMSVDNGVSWIVLTSSFSTTPVRAVMISGAQIILGGDTGKLASTARYTYNDATSFIVPNITDPAEAFPSNFHLYIKAAA